MNNTESVIDQANINALIGEIKKPSIIYMKPDDISKIEDPTFKQDQINRFKLVYTLYVEPLQRLLRIVCERSGENLPLFEEKDLSILESVRKLRDDLVKLGISPDNLLQIVPKTVGEVNDFLTHKDGSFHEAGGRNFRS